MENIIKKWLHLPSLGDKLIKPFFFFTGKFRYKLYYSENPYIKKLMRKHIREQITIRILLMNTECYENGFCIKCGCETPALQMINEPCEGLCYEKIFDKIDWSFIKNDYMDKMNLLIKQNSESEINKQIRL